jgi:hypothetical protein
MPMTRFGEIFSLKFMPVLLSLFLSACASTGAPYREALEVVPDTVQIVVFRPDAFFQGGIPYQVNINGKKAAVLRSGGFSVLDAQPGTVIVEIRASNLLQASFKNRSLSLNGTAKERIFVRAVPQLGNTVSLDVVSQGDAKLELKNLKESL